MNIRNYTSKVPATRSLMLIKEMLIEAGATNFMEQYEDGVIKGVAFQIDLNGMPMFFKIPGNMEAIHRFLVEKDNPRTNEAIERVQKQAQRTAWKIIYDWIQLQLSMIQLEQMEFMQAFLPYTYDVSNDQTFYDNLKASEFKLLTDGS